MARTLSEADLLDSLRAGRAFVGFDLLADTSSSLWSAEGPSGKAIMGESLPFAAGTRLKAHAPCVCRLTILRDGVPVQQTVGRVLEIEAAGPGLYRVEAELMLAGNWEPWVYANPIRLRVVGGLSSAAIDSAIFFGVRSNPEISPE